MISKLKHSVLSSDSLAGDVNSTATGESAAADDIAGRDLAVARAAGVVAVAADAACGEATARSAAVVAGETNVALLVAFHDEVAAERGRVRL